MLRFLALLLLTVPAWAASFTSGSSLPGTCTAGDLFTNTSQPAGRQIYECDTANHWTQTILLGGSGELAISAGALDGSSALLNNINSFSLSNSLTFTNGFSLACAATPAAAAPSTIRIFANTSCAPQQINNAGTVTSLGSGGGGSSWTVKQPYIFDGTNYFVPASGMASTTYSQGATSFDSRPQAFSTPTGWSNWGPSSVTPSNGPFGSWQVVNTGGGWAFYLAGYSASPSATREVSGIFRVGPVNGGTGEGAGLAAWDAPNLKLYTMAMYGTSIVINQFCWNPGGSSCSGGTAGPIYLSTVASYPSPGGVLQWRIAAVGTDLKFFSSMDGGGTWDTVDSLTAHSIGFSQLQWVGLFLADHSSMNVYTVGGIY